MGLVLPFSVADGSLRFTARTSVFQLCGKVLLGLTLFPKHPIDSVGNGFSHSLCIHITGDLIDMQVLIQWG